MSFALDVDALGNPGNYLCSTSDNHSPHSMKLESEDVVGDPFDFLANASNPFRLATGAGYHHSESFLSPAGLSSLIDAIPSINDTPNVVVRQNHPARRHSIASPMGLKVSPAAAAVAATPSNKRPKSSSTSPGHAMAADGDESCDSDDDSTSPCDSVSTSKNRIQWTVNDHETWHRIFDAQMNEIPQPGFRVEVDKGFKRSPNDGSFICQKKNHFQVTVALRMAGQPAFVATRQGLLKVSQLLVDMYGIKSESPSQHIVLEQSLPDRRKKKYEAAEIAVQPNEVTKMTVCRLHFSETTANNIRKKGKPNPDQRFFALVVSISAMADGELFTIASHRSENLIVRASNPGQFETGPTSQWVRGQTVGSVYHSGCVGINVDCPDEALCVRGNIRLSGAILQPLDSRLTTGLTRTHSVTHLQNIRRLPLHSYRLKRSWARSCGLSPDQQHLGVVTEEVAKVIPEAVQVTGLAVNIDDEEVDQVLVLDKERLFMETIGAVQALAEQNEMLLKRVAALERMCNSDYLQPFPAF